MQETSVEPSSISIWNTTKHCPSTSSNSALIGKSLPVFRECCYWKGVTADELWLLALAEWLLTSNLLWIGST